MKKKADLQQEACQLRKGGKSIKEISKMLGVAQSSVSVWVRGIELSDTQKAELHDRRRQIGKRNIGADANAKKYYAARLNYQTAGREQARKHYTLHLAGCMLYWAEGSKSRNRIEFVNSDPNMMRFFMRFLREELFVDDSAIKLNIHCHTQDILEQQRIQHYWLALLQLPESALSQVYVKQSGTFRRNRHANGVCGIRIENTELVQHIYGAIQEYGGFENPGWLF